VIHAFQASYAGGAGVLLKLFHPNIPFIVSLQEGKDLARQNFFVKFFRDLILKKADVITAISNYLLNYAKEINPKAKIYLLPNGVDIHKFQMTNDKFQRQPKTIATVSRLVPKNGIDTLIRAMAFLPGYTLSIAGTGADEQKLKTLAKNLKVTNRVSFLGNMSQDALPGILGRSSVFVRPSRSEGLGISFLEAMAAGIPVVGTPVGGILDFLKDRETGLFCEVENPESIAKAVLELEQSPKLREDLIIRALALIKACYDWNILAKKYYEIISHHSGL